MWFLWTNKHVISHEIPFHATKIAWKLAPGTAPLQSRRPSLHRNNRMQQQRLLRSASEFRGRKVWRFQKWLVYNPRCVPVGSMVLEDYEDFSAKLGHFFIWGVLMQQCAYSSTLGHASGFHMVPSIVLSSMGFTMIFHGFMCSWDNQSTLCSNFCFWEVVQKKTTPTVQSQSRWEWSCREWKVPYETRWSDGLYGRNLKKNRSCRGTSISGNLHMVPKKTGPWMDSQVGEEWQLQFHDGLWYIQL